MKIEDPNLGTLTFDGDGIADTVVLLDGEEIEVAIELDEEPSPKVIKAATSRVAKLAALDAASKDAIRAELQEGDEDAATIMYWSHHKDELSAQAIRSAFGVDSADDVSDAVFLKALHLLRVAVVPGSEDSEISLDYSIGEDVTNYLLVVRFDSEGEVSEISLES
ncbi:MAG: DUF2004 domain-containing protein [Myxococcales bacterium]|nr:DUF2004 domain-containing protein [Myxococcales bacterium]